VGGDSLGIAPDLNIYSSNPASNTALVAGDFDSLGTTAFCDTPILFTNWGTGYNDFALNASGLAAISKTGVSKFGLRNANYDVADELDPNNHDPSWSSDTTSAVSPWYSEKGEGYQPKLVVTYTTSGVDYPVATTSNLSINPIIDRDITWGRGISSLLSASPIINKSWGRTRSTTSNLNANPNVTRTSDVTRNTISNLSFNPIINRTYGRIQAISTGLTATISLVRNITYGRATLSALSLNPIITRVVIFTRAITTNLSLLVSVVIPTAVNYLITTITNLSLNPSVIRAITYTRSATTSLSMACSIIASRVLNYIARRFLKAPSTTYGSDVTKTGRYGGQE
jgi:hypothetical protein